MKNNYDNIASFYDALAKLVYGNRLVKAQVYLVNAIPAGASILIIGGGTGWILEEITKKHASGLDITYVDASAKMIIMAMKRRVGDNTVTFIPAPVETLQSKKPYDVIMTPFLLDNFTDDKMKEVFLLLHKQLATGGQWLYADFQNTNIWWQAALLKIMYVFFRVFCGVQAKTLADAQTCFSRYGYKVTGKHQYMNGFITTIRYKKREED